MQRLTKTNSITTRLRVRATMASSPIALGAGSARSGTTSPGSITISASDLLRLEEIVTFCKVTTGNPIQDLINQTMLSVLSSPNGSDVQERLISDACGAVHKGEKKLGADALLEDGNELEIKPSKSMSTTSSVNITDDTPSRLLKDLRNTGMKVAIGRCPGGHKFRWVVMCPMSDFTESRYKAMCKKWKQPEQPWPATVDEQVALVETLEAVRQEGEYLRSSQLKFCDVKNVLAFWLHPDENVSALKGKSAETELIRRLAGK